jgi:hypothetical protein
MMQKIKELTNVQHHWQRGGNESRTVRCAFSAPTKLNEAENTRHRRNDTEGDQPSRHEPIVFSGRDHVESPVDARRPVERTFPGIQVSSLCQWPGKRATGKEDKGQQASTARLA